MSVYVKFKCDGCDAEADGTKRLSRHFESVNGKGYGFGRHVYDSARDVAPDGWLAFDPYTGCCYCPACWKSIDAEADQMSQELNQ